MTRNMIRMLAGLALVVPLITSAWAQVGGPSNGIAMHGTPALPADFPHLPYVNPTAPKGGRLTIGFQGTFDNLNPFNVSAGSAAQGLNGNVFQTLMARNYDEPFSLYGLIAQSIETDDDRSHVTFRLDPRARFSDGTPITAQDVRFTFELLKTKGRPQSRSAYGQVKGIETPDDHTVRFDCTGTDDRELPLILALMPVLSQRNTDVAAFTQTSLRVPIASGPYMIASVQPGEAILLKRNPDYWAKDLPIARGLHNFDEIRIEYYRDATALYEAFKAGLLDYREETNPSRWLNGYDFPAIRDGRAIATKRPLGIPKGMQGFAFNTRRPFFADVRVREALQGLFDFEWINANLFGGLYTRTKSFFDESELASVGRTADARERALLAPFPNAVRPDVLEGTWRPPVSDGSGRDRALAQRALNLLGQAGYAVRDGVLRNRAGEPFSFEIMVGDRAQERLASNYADSLRRVGHRRAGAPRRRGAVPAPPTEIRIRHDDGHMVRFRLARQRAALALGLGQCRPGSLLQSRGRTIAGGGCDDRRHSRRALARGFHRRRARTGPSAAVGLLHCAAVSRIRPMVRRIDQTGVSRVRGALRGALYGATLDSWWRKAP